jgi:hypothetical protein
MIWADPDALIEDSLLATMRQISDLHRVIAPYPTEDTGLAERNLTHAFASALRRRDGSLFVLHEMPMRITTDEGVRRGALDTVLFNENVLILIEGKCLGKTEGIEGLHADWIRLNTKAEPAFHEHTARGVPGKRKVIRLLLADFWSNKARHDEDVVIRWLGSGRHEHLIGRETYAEYRENAVWWNENAKDTPASQKIFCKPIGDAPTDAGLKPRWHGFSSHHLWAVWRIDDER